MGKKSNVLVSKRFIIRKSLIGKGVVVQFTDYDGKVHKYNLIKWQKVEKLKN